MLEVYTIEVQPFMSAERHVRAFIFLTRKITSSSSILFIAYQRLIDRLFRFTGLMNRILHCLKSVGRTPILRPKE
jgi:hypothetical protein